MKNIYYHSLSYNNELLFDNSVRDNINQTNFLLKNYFLQHDYDFTAPEDAIVSQNDWVIFSEIVSTYQGIKGKLRKIKRKLLGLSSRDLFKELKSSHKNTILFLMEPETVIPENFNKNFHNNFRYIFTWDDLLIDNVKYFKIPAVPQSSNYPEVPLIDFDKKKLLLNISSNKYSNHRDELYSERIKTIRYFEKKHPQQFDLYGQGWDEKIKLTEKIFPILYKNYISYKGKPKNKWEVIPKYKFGIAYENIKNCYGYITEKIFDIMRCNSVPIYWGAENISKYVDENAFIDRRNFFSNEDLENFLLSMNEKDYNFRIEAIKAFLNSEKFKIFKNNDFFSLLVKTIVGNKK